MADHFYSIAGAGQAFERKLANIVVGAASTAGNPIELRVTDAAVTKEQLYEFCEALAEHVLNGGASTPFVPGTLL